MTTRWDIPDRQPMIRRFVGQKWKERAWRICLIYVSGEPRPDSPEISKLLGKSGWATVPAKYVIEGFPDYLRLSVWIFESHELLREMYKAHRPVGSIPFEKLEME